MSDFSNSKLKTQNSNLNTQSQTQISNPPLTREQKEAVSSLYKEGEPAVIEKKEPQVPQEVKEWVTEEKKEEAIELPHPIKDEYGEILMESVSPARPKINLPLTKQGLVQGVGKKVSNSIRWLVTWCIRLIKMFPGRVFYKKNA